MPQRTVNEAAISLDLAPSTIRQQISTGVLKATKFANVYTITDAEIERYRRENLGKRGRKAATK